MALTLSGTTTRLSEMLQDTSFETWTESEMQDYIADGVAFISRGRRPNVWIEAEDTSTTTTEEVLEYTLPTDFFYIAELWIEIDGTSPTRYALIREFKQWNGKFRLADWHKPAETGLTFRIKGLKKVSDITEVPDDEAEDVILDYAMYKAFMSLANDMTNFNKYSAKLQNISRNDVKLLANQHKENAMIGLRDIKRPFPPHFIGKGQY